MTPAYLASHKQAHGDHDARADGRVVLGPHILPEAADYLVVDGAALERNLYSSSGNKQREARRKRFSHT